MGLRGPRPKSNVAKFLRGETRPSRINEAEPELPAPASVRPPTGLTGVGLREWRRLSSLLVDRGVLTDADSAGFEDYCRCLSDLRRYERKAMQVGPELAIAKGYANMCVKLRGQATQLRSHLGLSPTSRASVKATPRRESSKSERFRAQRHSEGSVAS